MGSIFFKLIRLKRDLLAWKNGKYKNLFQWSKGFYNDTVLIDGITKDNFHNFISDREYLTGHPWNGSYSSIIDNKLYLPYLLFNYQEYLPATYLFKDKTGFLPIFQGTLLKEIAGKIRITVEEVLEIIKSKKTLILKHTHSSVGEGFHMVSHVNGSWFLDQNKIEENRLTEFLQSLNQYIFQEKIIQDNYASEINPSSVNTVRLQVAWNNNINSFVVVRAFHRFGANNQTVDNLGKGNGVLVYINPESGELLKEGVVTRNGVKEYIQDKEILHPDSNTLLSGMLLPGYTEMKEKIIEISNSISFLKWIGWDVALTNDGFKIIETNSLTTLDTIQQRTGLREAPWLAELFDKKF